MNKKIFKYDFGGLGSSNSKSNNTPQKETSKVVGTAKKTPTIEQKKIPTIELDRLPGKILSRFDDMNIVWYGRKNAIIWVNYSSLLLNDLNTTLDLLKMKSIANFENVSIPIIDIKIKDDKIFNSDLLEAFLEIQKESSKAKEKIDKDKLFYWLETIFLDNVNVDILNFETMLTLDTRKKIVDTWKKSHGGIYPSNPDIIATRIDHVYDTNWIPQLQKQMIDSITLVLYSYIVDDVSLFNQISKILNFQDDEKTKFFLFDLISLIVEGFAVIKNIPNIKDIMITTNIIEQSVGAEKSNQNYPLEITPISLSKTPAMVKKSFVLGFLVCATGIILGGAILKAIKKS